jgi:hypothetical protein
MLIATGCADPPRVPQVPTAAPPVLVGQARIWFYRDGNPPTASISQISAGSRLDVFHVGHRLMAALGIFLNV